jgi:hypothetical protein
LVIAEVIRGADTEAAPAGLSSGGVIVSGKLPFPERIGQFAASYLFF